MYYFHHSLVIIIVNSDSLNEILIFWLTGFILAANFAFPCSAYSVIENSDFLKVSFVVNVD